MESVNPHLMSAALSAFRMVVIGDIHEHWELEHDSKALEYLQPSLILFTGDFGNENVEIVRDVAGLNFPKAAILGNHDSWSSKSYSEDNETKNGVEMQLEYLGEQHVGYNRLDFPSLKLSVVGGRPFSIGGNKLFRGKLLRRYRVRNMKQSADRIHDAAKGILPEHLIILLAHNGPMGLGSNSDDICGKDWGTEGGDHGDPDLAQAISLIKESINNPLPLVVFGHMHKELEKGGNRKMLVVDGDSMYLNAAIVPRVKHLDFGSSIRAFTVVDFSAGKIIKVAETWVLVKENKISLQEENVLFSAKSEPVKVSRCSL